MKPVELLWRGVTAISGHQLLRPKYLVFESTSHCQFHCEVCGAIPMHCSRHRGMMDWCLFQHLVEEAVQLQPERIYLHAFGEPLLHPRIVDMVELLTRRGLKAELVTNGELLTPALARQLRQAGLFELGISHPNVSVANYQACRSKLPAKDIDARLTAAVAEWDGHDRQVTLRCLVIKKLLSKGAPETADYLNRWLNTPGVSLVALHGYLPWPKHVRPELIDFLLAKPRRCPVGMQSLSVLWDGVITPCSFDVNAELALGQAPKDSLVDLYNGAGLRRLRRNWLRRNHLPALCQNCLVPRCPMASAWIGRREWHEQMASGQRASLGKTSKRTRQNKPDILTDRF